MYKNPFDPDNKLITQKVGEWTRAKFSLGNEINLTISEVGCGDTNCPCIQTLITLDTNPQKMLHIGKPLTYVRKWDIDQIKY